MNNLHCTYSRRSVLATAASGFGWLAFSDLATRSCWAETAPAIVKDNPLAPKETHFPARAKRVIFLFMRGAPSHMDTFDYKPKLNADDGKEIDNGAGFGGTSEGDSSRVTLLGSPWKFAQHGESGLWVSDLFPNVAKHVDDLCVMRGMNTDVPAHPQAIIQTHCGVSAQVRPSIGSWLSYGLGTVNENLPGYVVLAPLTGTRCYSNAFLPAIHDATKIGVDGKTFDTAKLENAKNSRATTDLQRIQLDFAQSLNRQFLASQESSQQVEGAIESFELAFRMQGTMPDVLDLAEESQETLDMYGIGKGQTDDMGRRCLTARRLIEAGVRFVEVTHSDGGIGWDQHVALKAGHEKNCGQTDLPIAGLLADLKQRGLLEDTLVVWGGEFGRTPHAQSGDGRDHNNKGYTMWMAGGGLKAGLAYGETDEYGYEAIDGRVHVHDWHATMLHLLGLDHERLTYRYAGRDMRLTDVKGRVVHDIIA